MITLEKYNSKHTDDFAEFIKEFQQYGDKLGMMGLINMVMQHNNMKGTYLDLKKEQIPDFFKKYMNFIKNLTTYETLPSKKWIETDEYAICKDGKMIGKIMFRKRLNKFFLLHSYGHIGYSIKHSERGKGYGTIALKLMLDKVWEMGYGEVMISCKDNNIPSKRVIEKNGGILNRINMINPEEPEREYWIFNPKYNNY